MTMEIALALVAFSAPITAGILRFKNGNGNGNSSKYVPYREFDNHRHELSDRLTGIEGEIRDLKMYIQSRLK